MIDAPRSLTQTIHDELISAGKMKSTAEPPGGINAKRIQGTDNGTPAERVEWYRSLIPNRRPITTGSRLMLPGGVDVEFGGYAAPLPTDASSKPRIIRLRCIAALGDILYACAIAGAVRKSEPNAFISLETAYPALAAGNPNIDATIHPGTDFASGERLIDLRVELDWKPRRHRLVHLAEMARVPVGEVEFFMRSDHWSGLPDKYIVFHVGPTGVAEWTGRNWLPERWHALAEELSRDDLPMVAVGGDNSVSLPDSVIDLRTKTTVHQTAGIIELAHTFVGIESFPAIVAQVFGVPSVLFYGSILPELRGFRDNVSVVRAAGLACLGCHHDEPRPAITSVCRAGGEPCQADVSVEQFAADVRDSIQRHRGLRTGRISLPNHVEPDLVVDAEESTLIFDEDRGIAFQADRTKSVEYGQAYFDKYRILEGTPIANTLNDFRTSLAMRYGWKAFDMGIGSGEFVRKANMAVLGYDVNPHAVEWLKARGQFCDPYATGGIPSDVAVVTMWDVLEHLPEPDHFLKLIRSGCRLLVSIPIFSSLADIKLSKHYRPNEHYWYFTRDGLMKFMDVRGFDCVEILDNETRAGRESIMTFVFVKRCLATVVVRESESTQNNVVNHGEEVVRTKPVTVEDLGGWDRVIHFCLPSGIGDISWVYSKIWALPFPSALFERIRAWRRVA